ncbi:Mbov_0396 family ICE element transmembrane protein [Mesomycoplasma lagogenitalium]|uniref:Transmembrane protein n=1 Tax=Mesomycoplasma lagogenitalium TaxID=171286 RepID=A0ABY8LSQ8_9BACT|nr:hypothetical protein [Mesomycoplasma lagogenitalium]WGI36293.1 hypothetical protein QEG99_02325 [Mesomycoplasma lagogenitalium]
MFDIVDRIFYQFFKGFWYLFITIPFRFLSSLSKLFKWMELPLINFLLFNNSEKDLKYSEIQLPIFLIAFMILNSIVFLIIFISCILRWAFERNRGSENSSLMSVLKNIIPSIFLIFSIPLITFMILSISYKLFEVALIPFGEEKNVGQELFKLLKPDNIDENLWQKSAYDNFDVIPFEAYKNLKISSSELIFFSSIVGISLIIIFIKAALNLTNKTFQYLFLFIISPFVFSSIMIDKGKRYLIWRKMFLSKIVVIFSYIFAIKLFAFYALILNQWINNIEELGHFEKLSLRSILTVGGAIGCLQIIKLVSKILEEKYKNKDNINEFKQIIEQNSVLNSIVKNYSKTSFEDWNKVFNEKVINNQNLIKDSDFDRKQTFYSNLNFENNYKKNNFENKNSLLERIKNVTTKKY